MTYLTVVKSLLIQRTHLKHKFLLFKSDYRLETIYCLFDGKKLMDKWYGSWHLVVPC